MLIDTHCHLNFKAFEGKVDAVIRQAKQAGVKTIIVPGAKLDSSQKAVGLAEKYEGVYAAAGVHPTHAEESLEKGLKVSRFKSLKKKLFQFTQNKKVVAIGECGLDNYRIVQLSNCKLLQKAQRSIFEIQIQLAQELKLPLIIHNRQASGDILRLFTDHYSLITNFVFHCFEGDEPIWEFVQKNPGGHVGITNNITYNHRLQKILPKIPLNKIVLETDSPWQLPKTPNRSFSFPNTPANVTIVAEWIASIKRVPLAEVTKVTTENAKRLFSIV